MGNITYRMFDAENVSQELSTLIAARIVSAVLYKDKYIVARSGVNKTTLKKIIKKKLG